MNSFCARFPMFGRLERPLFAQAGDLLRQAIARRARPRAPAHAWLAYWMILQIGQGWSRTPRPRSARPMRLAERAVMLDSAGRDGADDRRACPRANCQSPLAARRSSLHERALLLNPNLALAWNLSGVAYA